MGARVLLVAAVSLAVAPAYGQRREGRRSTSVLEVRLPVSVEFGELKLAPRSYRVTLSRGTFALADPQTMVLIASVPFIEAEAAEVVDPPRVDVVRSGSSVEIVLRAGDRIYRAAGIVAEDKSPAPSPVVLAGKQERVVEGGPAQPTATDLVARATRRYMGGIKHCADKAHRSHWGTDDHRFIQCVCPIVLRWKMPPIAAPLLMHWPLARGRHGFSFHVTPVGKVTSCRVWAGPKPPEPTVAESAPESSAPESATPSTPQPARSSAPEAEKHP